MKEKEIWKKAKGYNNYLISNLGRVKSVKFNKERILKQSNNAKGNYFYTTLSKNGVKRTTRIHRLVIEAFMGKFNGKEANHINGDKSDNRLCNLEQVTHKQNVDHAFETSLSSNDRLKKKIMQLDSKEKIIDIFDSLTEANEKTKINLGSISNCLHNRYKSAGNFNWKFAEC